MNTVKVLIADDSVVYRSQVRAALAHFKWIEVVGAASNGRLAIENLKVTRADLLILDLEMPEMDGLATLNEIARLDLAVKVLVFSSASKRGADITFEALRLGAKDFVTKPGSDISISPAQMNPNDRIRVLLEPKLQALFPVESRSERPAVISTPVAPLSFSDRPAYPKLIWDLFRPRIVVIGSSTGGPTVLEKIFSELKFALQVPVLITQHMPPIFTASLAERLSRLSGQRVKEAEQGEAVVAGTVYIAPGDFHMTVRGTAERPLINLDQGPLVNSVRPAVDNLFVSVAEIFKEKTLGIVLTGMGADGRVGAQAIKGKAGGVAIQEKNSCVVFGMPGAVFEAGAFDQICTPDEIITLLGGEKKYA